MVMRTCTGSGTAQTADGRVKGKNGGQSPNCTEIVKYISSEDQMLRIAAVTQAAAFPRALAYLAVTAQHEDVREAAKAQLLKNGLRILSGMTGRTLEPWEKETVKLIREGLNDYNGWDKVLVDAKLMQIEKGKYSGAYDQADGVEFVDESPPQFSEKQFADILTSE